MEFKVHKTYKGLKIYKAYRFVVGSDYRETEDNRLIRCKPQFDIVFCCGICQFYPFDSLKEIKAYIDEHLPTFSTDEENGYTLKDVIDVLNEPNGFDTVSEELGQVFYTYGYIKNWHENENNEKEL